MKIDTSVTPRVMTLISDQDHAILIQVRDNLRANYFAIGDMANKYVYLCAKHKYPHTAQEIYDTVGRVVGKSGRTVRYYAEEAGFYADEIRDQFDILPFSFFVFARSMGELWLEVLAYSMAHPDYSLAAIRRHFLYPQPAVEADEQQEIEEQVELRGTTAPSFGLCISVLLELSAKAVSLTESAPIPDSTKFKLRTAVQEIREALTALAPEPE